LIHLVIDASVLGKVCEEEFKREAIKILKMVMAKRPRVIICKEILKEYKPLGYKRKCNNHEKRLLQEWYKHARGKHCKSVKIDKNDINKCFSELLTRRDNKFKKQDIIYVKAAEKVKEGNKTLIAHDRHFENADSCLEQLGIRRLDLDCAVEFLDAM
jgi:hypothetical protein